MLAMTLAKRIRDFRYAKGWGPDELAGRAQISRTALYQIECGKTETPRASTLSRIARALGVSIESLLGFDSPSLISDQTARLATPQLDDDSGERAIVNDVFEVASPQLVVASRPSSASAGVRQRDLQTKFFEIMDSPLGDGLARIIEESYRLLPSARERSVV